MICRSCGARNSAGARFCDQCGAQLAVPTEPTSGYEKAWVLSPGFVGRERELEDLRTALHDALAGKPRLVMMAGEPGIGKTRTAQELSAHAIDLGVSVLWGRCHSSEGAPPYWPWIQILRAYLRDSDGDQLRCQMGPAAAVISEIVPEIKDRIPDLEPSPDLEPQQARFSLFDSIGGFLKGASRAQPLLLVLDNLHSADRTSLLLLEFLAQELSEGQLLVLGTYRDNELTRRHPLTQTLGEVAREALFRRVVLRGLNKSEVAGFITVHGAFTPSSSLVEAVFLQTEGNPLFVTQVVQLMLQEGKLKPESGKELHHPSVPVPVGVREIIGRRLERLSERCNQVLVIASVVGREFELDLLERLILSPGAEPLPEAGIREEGPWSEEALLAAVEEALAAKVIEEIIPTGGRYQFAHLLIQDTLAQELSGTRRARLHRRIGGELEKLYGNDASIHAAELAFHFAEAGTATDTDRLVRYSHLAGEQARAAYAWEDALLHFSRALEHKEGQPMDGEMAVLSVGIANAQLATREQYETQRMQQAIEHLNRAFNYYADLEDVEKAVALAEYPVRSVFGVQIGERDLITRALALVPPDSHQAGRLLPNYGLILYQEEGDYEGTQEAFDQALAIAAREQDTALEMRTLAYATYVDFHHFRWEECLAKGARAIRLSDSVNDPYAETVAPFFTARALDFMGDPETAWQRVEEMLNSAERFRHQDLLARALYISGLLSLHQGNWQGTRDSIDRSLDIAPGNPPHLCARAVLEYLPGDFDQGQKHVDRLVESTRRYNMGAGFA